QRVQGTLTVSAIASDIGGVVGVPLFPYAALFRSEDTSAPYSVSVGTSTSDNGSHTLTAVARDAAGNSKTSAPVTVTIANGSPPRSTPPTAGLNSPCNGQSLHGPQTVSANPPDNLG